MIRLTDVLAAILFRMLGFLMPNFIPISIDLQFEGSLFRTSRSRCVSWRQFLETALAYNSTMFIEEDKLPPDVVRFRPNRQQLV
jgi:hypothetical protein